MSTTPLSDIQEVIERSIFEQIRQEIVDKGYLPDIAAFSDDVAGEQGYLAEIPNVIAAKGFAIELFNESTNHDKGLKQVPRIVIKTGSFLQGNLGGDPKGFFVDNGADFTHKVTPPQTSDFFFNVCLVSGSVEQERILHALLALALPKRKYVKWYNNSNLSFFSENINYYELDNNDQGIIEKVYAYQIPDCWDMEDVEIRTGVAKINEITLNPLVQKYYEGSIGYNADPLVVT